MARRSAKDSEKILRLSSRAQRGLLALLAAVPIWSRARGARAPAPRGERSRSKRAALATPYRRSALRASAKQIPRCARDDNQFSRQEPPTTHRQPATTFRFMMLVVTEAIVLHVFDYLESS